MKRILATAAALALATSAHALVVTENLTMGDTTQTYSEDNADFIGDPVFDANGMKIGTVSHVDSNAAGDRRIHVMFDEGAVD
ncbi:PRC-barrel domain-containing protein, partial [Cribrihabitans sp. XS_ASV171]